MDQAGCLNSMTDEQLKVTCSRLQRSCKDMEMLLSEFEQEQALLRREHDRLHQRIEKVTSQTQEKDQGLLWNVMHELDKELGVSQIFRAKEERKAAKRRRWRREGGAEGGVTAIRTGKSRRTSSLVPAAVGEEECGPFSEAIIQMSWGNDVSHGILRQSPSTALEEELNHWIRETLSAESVAEAAQEGAWGPHYGNVRHELPPVIKHEPQRYEPQRSSPRCNSPPPSHLQRSPPPSARREPMTTKRTTSRPETVASSPKSRSGYGPDGESQWDGEASPFEALVSAVGDTTLHRQMTRALRNAADMASTLLPAESSASRRDESPPRIESVEATVKVELRRQGTQSKWGLAWEKKGFKDRKDRVVERLEPESVAESWNKWQEQQGHPELKIQPGDRLMSVNGKSLPDEMKIALQGTEVLLEFRRIVTRRVVPSPEGRRSPSPERFCGAAPTPQASVISSTPGTLICSAPVSPARGVHRKAFQAAFTEYLTKAAPDLVLADAEKDDALNLKEASDGRGEKLAKLEDQSVDLPAVETADVAQAPLRGLALLPWDLLEEDEGEGSPTLGVADQGVSEKVSPQEAPHSLVVQVLSQGAGSLKLSWLFDWAVLPGVADEARGEKLFDVVRRQEDTGEVTHHHCPRPPLELELPVGNQYSFEVHAFLSDTRVDASAEGAARRLWTSSASPAALADLRTPASPSGQQVAPEEKQSFQPPARRRGVAASMGAFMEQRTAAAISTAVAAATPTPPTSPTGPVPNGDASAGRPNTPSGGSEGSGAVVVMGGSANPLTSSRLRTSAVNMLDPIREKQDVAELLRARREKPSNDLRQRSSSFDSDDEFSLQRLSKAMSSLERTEATKLKEDPEYMVAKEGHHRLEDRMEAECSTRSTSGIKRGSTSAAAAAAAFASGHLTHDMAPMARPAQESADDGAGLGDASAVAMASELAACSLVVDVGDGKAHTLEFSPADDLAKRVRDFVAQHGMIQVIEGPLLTRAAGMLSEQKREDRVDICDLL